MDELEFLAEHYNEDCPTCESDMIEIAWKQLPNEMKVGNPENEDDLYLFCPTCGNYKIIPFLFTEPKKKQSLNAPCLCGSGKKYKRCCGK